MTSTDGAKSKGTMNGEIERVDPGITGIADLAHGGLPRSRLTLVAGTAGSGKTVFCTQFLAGGVAKGEPVVFATFEERPDAVRRNVRSFGWDIERWEKEGLWMFVDASPDFGQDTFMLGEYDLSPLVERVEHAVRSVGAKRVAMDSVGSLLAQFEDPRPARLALFQLASALEEMGVTSVITAERIDDYGPVAQYGFEEFVADGVVILRNALEGEKRRRTAEILKLRGGSHMKGEHLFTLKPGQGIVVVPQVASEFEFTSSKSRVSSGNAALDQMLRGGFFEKSLILVEGPTGSGKSLVTAQFTNGGALNGERTLLHSFEEGRDQLLRNAEEWGIDFAGLEDKGNLVIVAEAPETHSLEDHLLRLKEGIEEFKPDRVAIDSLTALQRISTVRTFREYLLGLAFHIKSQALVALMTMTTDVPKSSVSDLHVSTISDTIMLLHYVGVGGEIRRGINVLKMRGSDHDKSVREFTIDGSGMHIGDPFHDLRGDLTRIYAPRASVDA